MSANDQYALNWSNHTNHMRKAFDSLLAGSEFVDVTLSCEGKKVSAHKMLLSACSTYFHDLFRDNPCQHPIVILKDVKFQNLIDILKFIYNGEVSVATENFDSFLKTAELLQVSGLTDDESRYGVGDREEETQENPQVSLVQQAEQTSIRPVSKKSSPEKPKEKDISKRRTAEVSTEESTSQKKRKENELRADIEIKQEAADVSLDDEQIKDPLELEQQNETLEEMELLQPVRTKRVQKHKLAQTTRRDASDRKIRRPCFHCYSKIRKTLGSRLANNKAKKVTTYCGACHNKPFMCTDCYEYFH